jgi:hypothetical protein
MLFVDVGDQRFELVFGAAGGEVGDLRLEGSRPDRRWHRRWLAEFEDGVVACP